MRIPPKFKCGQRIHGSSGGAEGNHHLYPATLSGVESQLQAHIGMGINTGITEEQLKKAFLLIGTMVGKKEGDSALEVLTKVVEARNENNK